MEFEAIISSLCSVPDAVDMRYEEFLVIKDAKIHEGWSTIEKDRHERDEFRQTIASMEKATFERSA
jgi:hypothetical protein